MLEPMPAPMNVHPLVASASIAAERMAAPHRTRWLPGSMLSLLPQVAVRAIADYTLVRSGWEQTLWRRWPFARSSPDDPRDQPSTFDTSQWSHRAHRAQAVEIRCESHGIRAATAVRHEDFA